MCIIYKDTNMLLGCRSLSTHRDCFDPGLDWIENIRDLSLNGVWHLRSTKQLGSAFTDGF